MAVLTYFGELTKTKHLSASHSVVRIRTGYLLVTIQTHYGSPIAWHEQSTCDVNSTHKYHIAEL